MAAIDWYTKILNEALSTPEDVKIASSKDLKVVMTIPKWVVLGYMLYELQKVGKWKGRVLPPKSVKLAKALQELG